MVLLETADSPISAAGIISSKLPQELSKTAVTLYTVLVAVGIETARAKGYSANVTHMVMHAPLEQVARAVSLSRQTVWRHLPALKALGVLDYWTHKGACRGATWNTGTVFMVRLNPASGRACRLSYQDLKHHWRNLDRDVRAGRTSYQALKHTQALQTGLMNVQRVLNWTLRFSTNSKLVTDVCNSPRKLNLESLFDVRHATKQERSRAVDTAAQALAQALADSRSVNFFYRRIIHGSLRANQGTVDYFQVLYNLAVRSRVDVQEGFARRDGALFVSRLKQAGLLEELMQT